MYGRTRVSAVILHQNQFNDRLIYENNDFIPDSPAVRRVWKPPGAAGRHLSTRQQSIVAIAANTATGDLENLKIALARGLDNGMTVNEVKEVLVHAYAYCGFPRSLRALQTFMQVLDERKAQGITDLMGRDASPVGDSRDKYTRGAELLEKLSGAPKDAPKTGYAAFAPVIEQYLKEHLFCDIFERDLLTWQERELATVSILAALGEGVEPMLRSHSAICLRQGITENQLRQMTAIATGN